MSFSARHTDPQACPEVSRRKPRLLLIPVYTTDAVVGGTRHAISMDGHSGQIASTVRMHLTVGAQLAVAALLGGLVALLWWVISRLIA